MGVGYPVPHIHHDLTQGGVEWAWLLPAFHRNIADWWALALQAAVRPTHLAKIVRREPTHLRFCDASDIGARSLCINPEKTGHNLVWRHPWPPDIIEDLVLSTNMKGTITNSYLELVTLVVHKATLLAAFPEVRMVVPRSGSYNNPTVSWSTREASVINPVVADLLRIHVLHSIYVFLESSVF